MTVLHVIARLPASGTERQMAGMLRAMRRGRPRRPPRAGRAGPGLAAGSRARWRRGRGRRAVRRAVVEPAPARRAAPGWSARRRARRRAHLAVGRQPGRTGRRWARARPACDRDVGAARRGLPPRLAAAAGPRCRTADRRLHRQLARRRRVRRAGTRRGRRPRAPRAQRHRHPGLPPPAGATRADTCRRRCRGSARRAEGLRRAGGTPWPSSARVSTSSSRSPATDPCATTSSDRPPSATSRWSCAASSPSRATSRTSLLPVSTFFAMSSHYEGLPNALLEAQACGIPAVAAPDGPGIAEASGPDVELVAVGDASALAEWARRAAGPRPRPCARRPAHSSPTSRPNHRRVFGACHGHEGGRGGRERGGAP